MENELDILLRRQKVLADFGGFALQSEELDEVLTEACRLVGEAMETGRAKVLEIAQDGASLLVRAGVGWARDIVGQVRLPMSERSSETFTTSGRKNGTDSAGGAGLGGVGVGGSGGIGPAELCRTQSFSVPGITPPRNRRYS
ncbi:hypothetical protein [Microvirga massiliensis]|uniref:hypothetical protein n=1 Tax=Microvirga massiliensis TaxID=1033741 RepID=UPI00062B5B3E|nr:hypothetical protein [Microvirga massiliensis]